MLLFLSHEYGAISSLLWRQNNYWLHILRATPFPCVRWRQCLPFSRPLSLLRHAKRFLSHLSFPNRLSHNIGRKSPGQQLPIPPDQVSSSLLSLSPLLFCFCLLSFFPSFLPSLAQVQLLPNVLLLLLLRVLEHRRRRLLRPLWLCSPLRNVRRSVCASLAARSLSFSVFSA
jgi:hypothetical protein